MSRGKTKQAPGAPGNQLPRFIDVPLPGERRGEFIAWMKAQGDVVRALQDLADDGYRVGVSYSGKQSAYTVSVTCRAEGDPNEGLCMTSFAALLPTAIWLAVYKHTVVTGGVWSAGESANSEEFG